MMAQIGCVILAGGGGRRFGGNMPKLLLPIAGKPLLQHAIDAATGSRAMGCTLVLGADADHILSVVDPRRCSIVRNDGWREGIASSLRSGLARHRSDEACIFMVADQPCVETDDLDGLLECHNKAPGVVAALKSGDVWGTPMLFPQTLFPMLERLSGDTGAKQLVRSKGLEVRFWRAASPSAFSDVDTLVDYELMQRAKMRGQRTRVRSAG